MSEIVVVGGGLGGLTAAVALAGKGHEVTLLEKEPLVGGYAVDVHRKGRVYDLALHVVPCGGAGQEFERMLSELGVAEDVSFIRLKEGFRVCFGSDSLQLPNDYEGLFATLELEFPDEADNLRRFRRDLEEHTDAYAPLFDYGVSKWTSVPPFIMRAPKFLKHAGQPARQYLEQFFTDPRLMAILFQPAVFMGMPMDEFPTVNFMMMFRLLMQGGMYTIAGGGQSLTRALESRLRALGGTIVTRAKATRILVKRNAAIGVETADGKTYPADGVVANVNLPEIVDGLLDAAVLPPSYVAAVKGLRPSLSALVMNLWLDCPAEELGIHNHITIAFPDPDIDSWIKKQRASRFVDGFSVTAHGHTEPALVSPERATLSIVGGTDSSQWLALEGDAYRQAKAETAEDMLRKVERVFPGLREHVMFSELATPRTMRRYTGNPSGAIMGFECAAGGHRKILAAGRIPVRRLALASAWTDRLGGFMQCVKAGLFAAEKVLPGKGGRDV
jgi:phytoene dehydrogenase-like protein